LEGRSRHSASKDSIIRVRITLLDVDPAIGPSFEAPGSNACQHPFTGRGCFQDGAV
jgi:hypothetical protein